MEIISIDAIISSYFSTNVKKEEVDFTTLNKFKKGLQDKFEKNKNPVYVRYQKNDLLILGSDSNYEGIFEVDFEQNKIKYNRDKKLPPWMQIIPHKIKKEDYQKFFLEVNSELN